MNSQCRPYKRIHLPKIDGSGYWKWELLEDIYFRVPMEFTEWFTDINFKTERFFVVETDWYSINSSYLTVRKGYAIDGMTCFPDLHRWLTHAFAHDALCQAIHDDKLIPESLINVSHEVFEEIGLDGKIISGGLKLLHKPWRRLNERF